MKFFICLYTALAAFLPFAAKAQNDTLVVDILQADSIFLTNNFLLLAKRYEVEANRALIKQAKLWNNPNILVEGNVYNPAKGSFFDVGSTGQKIFSVQQVINLAGQRNKRILLAKQNAQLNEMEFYNLMREFKLELRNDFYFIYFNTRTIKKYDYQLSLLKTIIDVFDEQYKKGNIPLKEVLRLKAVYLELNNNRSTLFSSLSEAQRNLSVLLQTNQIIKPHLNDGTLSAYSLTGLTEASVLEKALQFRPDLKATELGILQAETSLKLQRKQNIPNLQVGGIYDQAGSYINNYTGISLSIDLPLFNRNSGNIGYAKNMIQSAKMVHHNKNVEIIAEVRSCLEKLRQTEEEYSRIDNSFRSDFEVLNAGVLENFQKRNISLLEFIDFFEAYNESIAVINQLRAKRIKTYEELNYITGTELFKY